MRTVGRNLGDVPFNFGWELVAFEPGKVQTGSDNGSQEKGEQTGSVPVLGERESRPWSGPGYEEQLDYPLSLNLVRVGNLEDTSSDESEAPIEVAPLQPTEIVRPSEREPRRRFKTFASRTDAPPVRRPRTRSSVFSSPSAPQTTSSQTTK